MISRTNWKYLLLYRYWISTSQLLISQEIYFKSISNSWFQKYLDISNIRMSSEIQENPKKPKKWTNESEIGCYDSRYIVKGMLISRKFRHQLQSRKLGKVEGIDCTRKLNTVNSKKFAKEEEERMNSWSRLLKFDNRDVETRQRDEKFRDHGSRADAKRKLEETRGRDGGLRWIRDRWPSERDSRTRRKTGRSAAHGRLLDPLEVNQRFNKWSFLL